MEAMPSEKKMTKETKGRRKLKQTGVRTGAPDLAPTRPAPSPARRFNKRNGIQRAIPAPRPACRAHRRNEFLIPAPGPACRNHRRHFRLHGRRRRLCRRNDANSACFGLEPCNAINTPLDPRSRVRHNLKLDLALPSIPLRVSSLLRWGIIPRVSRPLRIRISLRLATLLP